MHVLAVIIVIEWREAAKSDEQTYPRIIQSRKILTSTWTVNVEEVENGRAAHAEHRPKYMHKEGDLRDLIFDFGRIFHDRAKDQPVSESRISSDN
jgi:hypothetical protein